MLGWRKWTLEPPVVSLNTANKGNDTPFMKDKPTLEQEAASRRRTQSIFFLVFFIAIQLLFAEFCSGVAGPETGQLIRLVTLVIAGIWGISIWVANK